MKKLIVLLVLLAGLGYAGSQGFDWYSGNVQSPMQAASHPVAFKVAPGEGPTEIGNDLVAKGLIRSRLAFDLYLRQSGARDQLQAGDFLLNRNQNLPQIVDTLEHGKLDQVAVRMPEGYTYKMLADEAAKAGIGSAADYRAQAEAVAVWAAQYDFLRDRPATAPANLEGFLYPDSYSLNKDSTARDLVKRQLDRFGAAFPPELRAQAAQPAAGRPAESVYNLVTLASLVEREVNRDPDRAIVCGILYNRLAQNERLDIDATVEYALGKWKATLTQDDLNVNSPYNTRRFSGLPPGPISQASTASIRACVAPQKSDFLFYFSDTKGVTHYAKTIAEFTQQQQQFGVSGQ